MYNYKKMYILIYTFDQLISHTHFLSKIVLPLLLIPQ